MKMKMLTAICTLVLSLPVFADQNGSSVSSAKAIELSAHRIDRLVSLGKIDAAFLKKLEKIELVVVSNEAPAFYKIKASQTKPSQGNPLQLEIAMDVNGKTLSYQVVAAGVAGADPGFTDKDAASLTENALHYVLENTNQGKVAMFDKGASSFVLSKQTLDGVTVVLGQLTSTLTTEKLNIYLKLDGTFIKAEVVP